MDGVHLLYQAELGYVWCRKPVIVKSAYGRKRFNVLGAYNFNTSETEVVSNVELVYLPSYSPNLNLIERLWKWLRKECLRNQYKETFSIFCKDDKLSKTGSDFLDVIKSWLAPNFKVLGD